jgi:hypothetical protein
LLTANLFSGDTNLMDIRHINKMLQRGLTVFSLFFCLIVCAEGVFAQTSEEPQTTLPPPSVAEKWDHFTTETFTPLTLGAGAFNAAVSQVTESTPVYGHEFFPAYPERFGSSVGDIISQNFFGDFLLASAFHEDTRYVRRGPSHKLVPRILYAISRSVVTRTDSGEDTFNASNVLGTAMSAALSNAYYPPASRTVRAAELNWGSSVGGAGFANLLPEFWPDFHAWMRRHLPPAH